MINVVCGIRSTGRICTDIATALEVEGHEVKIAYGREKVPEQFLKYAVKIGTDFDVKLHGIRARIVDGVGFGSKAATKKFIEWVKEWNPDVIHLHNLHGYYINIEVLFNYLKTCGKNIIWTLHDCWAFTGHCTYFDYIRCVQWKTGCVKCPQKKEYPKCDVISRATQNYEKKKELFTGISDMLLVTPSDWLGRKIEQSFMKEYTVTTIHNGIDTKVFKPTTSDIKKKYSLQGRKVILGVAAMWDRRKGLKYMMELSEKLDNSYAVVAIGVTEEQKKQLPANMLGILQTESTEDLVKWYSAADVFVNPTLEDNYPTTNLEAIACGTPVVSFDTGGSSESAKLYGVVSPKGNIDALLKAIDEALTLKKANNVDLFSYKYMSRLYIEQYERQVQHGGAT